MADQKTIPPKRFIGLALSALQGPCAQNARQEVEINFILKEHQNFTVPGLFLVLFQLFDLAAVVRIRTGDREYRTQHSVS